MRVNLISKRYSKALFDLALELQLLEETYQDMLSVKRLVRENREFRVFLESPIIQPKKKNAVLIKLFESRIQEVSLRFLQIITRKGREKFIGEIARQFELDYKSYKNIVEATITSASKLDASARKEILRRLEARTGKTVELKEAIRDELIGGFVINLADAQYDASISTMLSRMEHEFESNQYKVKY